MTDWADRMQRALATGSPYPSAQSVYPHMTLADAYDLQREFVAVRHAAVAGFKAALTAPAAQAAMGIDQPVIGALFDDGLRVPGTLEPDRAVLLETEFGYCLARDIIDPVSPAHAFEPIAHAAPMIELAAPNLPGKPNGVDLVATNSASYAYLPGAAFALHGTDPDLIDTALFLDGEVVLSGNGRDVLDGQRHALAWLINQVLELGYELKAGHWLMTGSIGGMAPGKPGEYVARYDGLADIAFELAT